MTKQIPYDWIKVAETVSDMRRIDYYILPNNKVKLHYMNLDFSGQPISDDDDILSLTDSSLISHIRCNIGSKEFRWLI